MTRRLFPCLLAVAVIVSPGNIQAQVEQGAITGKVFDQAGTRDAARATAITTQMAQWIDGKEFS